MSLKCAKFAFSLLCVLFLITGVALSVFALWTVYDENSRVHVLYPTLVKDLTPVLWIVSLIGMAIAVISLVGVCGVLRESRCCLIVYFVAVLFALIGLSSCLVAASVLTQIDSEGLNGLMYKRFVDSYEHGTVFQTVVDQIQTDLHCCGVYNYTDYQSTNWYKKETGSEQTREKVPSSCCNVPQLAESATNAEFSQRDERIDSCKTLRDKALIYPPCSAAIERLYWSHRGWIIPAAVFVGLLMLSLLALSCHIQSRVHGDYSLRGHFV